MGNQVSSNLKHALLLESYKKKNSHSHNHNHPRNKQDSKEKQIIGILSFEVANALSKTVHLHKSLTDSEISKLKNEILKYEEVKNLVSNDESYLIELALAEKLDDLNRVANVVSRLGKKCVEPALQGFEHVYADIISGVIDVKELGFLVKDMEGMVKKMERYVNATSNLYSELEVLNELEQATKKFQQNQHEESRRAFEQKLIWQKQDVRHLKEISLWNQTCDKVVELMARTVCTIYARISVVFGESKLQKKGPGAAEGACSSPPMKEECGEVSDHIGDLLNSQRVSGPLRRAVTKRRSNGCQSGPIERAMMEKRETYIKPQISSRKGEADLLFRTEDIVFPCGTSPGRLFLDCLSLSSSASKFDDDDSCVVVDEDQRSQISRCYSVGNGSLKREHPSPSSLGEEARDDLYQMLPTSLRLSLRTNLKSYVKNLAIYDAPLAHDWKDTLDGILRGKTETAICELLVGLNYICRYEHQQNALLDCASSFDFEDCMQWQLQCRASFVD
ncbi:hypothetical protein D5086_016880 [Populus alba]|uniref:Uncharacterized protein n=1 Tax=Populus alba TaxID=43335 RepID=A0ACC4BV83_POPAL